VKDSRNLKRSARALFSRDNVLPSILLFLILIRGSLAVMKLVQVPVQVPVPVPVQVLEKIVRVLFSANAFGSTIRYLLATRLILLRSHYRTCT
jgi:hypothetical protein